MGLIMKLLRPILALVLLLLSGAAQAHANCDAFAVADGTVVVGSAQKTVSTPQGEADAWWCQLSPADQGGVSIWKPMVVYRLHRWRDTSSLLSAAQRVLTASDSWKQVEIEMRGASRVVVRGTQDYDDVALLRWHACRALRTAPMPEFQPNANGTPVSAADCGSTPPPPTYVAPPPPPPPVGVYVVTGSQAYPLNANGTRSITTWPTPPTKGETCDCAVQIMQYTTRFCRIPRLSTPTQTVVAGCALKP